MSTEAVTLAKAYLFPPTTLLQVKKPAALRAAGFFLD